MNTKPKSNKKKLLVTVAVLVTGYYGYNHFFGGGAHGGMGMGGPMPVTVADALERDVTEWDEFSGRLEAVENVEVRPRVSGTIDQVHFNDGDVVKKGQQLFTIDPRPYAADLAKAEAALATANARHVLAQGELSRSGKLLEEGAIAKRVHDERTNAARVAEAEVKSAAATLAQAKLNLEYTKVLAPVTGRVGRAEITVGNMVDAGPGAPILTTIVSDNPVYASFDADETTFVKYLGARGHDPEKLRDVPVYLRLSGEKGWPHEGRVKSFDNQLNTRSGSIRVRGQFDNKDGALVPGLFAQVRIGGAGESHAVLVSDRAIGTDQSKKFVYVIDEKGNANYREIKLGGMADGLRVVKDGLKGGETIVVNGLQRVRPGAPVIPQKIDMTDADKPAPPPGAPGAEGAAAGAEAAPEKKAEEKPKSVVEKPESEQK